MMTHMHKAGQGCAPEEKPSKEVLERWIRAVPSAVGAAANAATTAATGSHTAGSVAGKLASGAMQSAIEGDEELRLHSADVLREGVHKTGEAALAMVLVVAGPVLLPALLIYSLFKKDEPTRSNPPSNSNGNGGQNNNG